MPLPDNAPVRERTSPREAVQAIGQELCRLPPGDLASLRRTAETDLRAPHYWRWKHRHGWPDRQDAAWATIIACMAILTAKGRNPDKPSPHRGDTPFGKVLCDGGDPEWQQRRPLRPLISEQRLARLLNARGETRHRALLRIVRTLARDPVVFNCTDLAHFLLEQEADWPAQKIARTYYTRLDAAEQQSGHTQTTEKNREVHEND